MVRIRNTALLFVSLGARERTLMYVCENAEFMPVIADYMRADVYIS